ncbi:MAG: GNAT family N-acetyltransferase [Deltaproteobacteria bacterium]|nr:GNAT family N-acetyltransferase [Deltaproteobacteria bacterium]
MPEVLIRGYYPGVVGKITELHAVYYHEHWEFDVSFETQVGRELSTFVSEFDADRDGLWVVTADGKFAGAVAIDGIHAMTEGARLRWFIVDPEFQGAGLGNRLIAQAVQFCKAKRYPKIFLWTFAGLDPARRLYERHDFRLCETHEADQWGQTIKEQKFELLL